MILAITGAGASYDAITADDDYDRMPLVAGLFDNRNFNVGSLRLYRQSSPIVRQLEDSVKQGYSTVEEQLRQIQDESDADVILQRQFLALRMYLRRTIALQSSNILKNSGGKTSYTALVTKLYRYAKDTHEQVAYVDFNYDNLLEHALTSFYDTKLDQVADYTRYSDFKLFKPHGSIRWYSDPKFDKPGLTFKDDVDLISKANWVDEPDVNDIKIDDACGLAGTPDMPVIAVPAKGKNFFSCPDRHIEQLKGLLGSCTTVLAIGWRAVEEHFQVLLKEAKFRPKVLIVGNSETGTLEVARNLSDICGPPSPAPSYCNEGFAAFASSRAFEEFIAK